MPAIKPYSLLSILLICGFSTCFAYLPHNTYSSFPKSPELPESLEIEPAILMHGNTASTLTSGTSLNSGLDTIPPTIICPNIQTIFLDANCSSILPDFISLATITDNCPGVVAASQNPNPGTALSGLGSLAITITATDSSGNTSYCSFLVNRLDTIAPSLTCPGPQTQSVGPNCSMTLANYWSSVNPLDNCSIGVTISQSPLPGAIYSSNFPVTVTITATDSSGNSSNCNFLVSPVDLLAPWLTCPNPPSIYLDANCEWVVPDLQSTLTIVENCTAAPNVNQSPPIGTVISSPGTYTFGFSATDSSNNTGTCDYFAFFQDGSPPNIVCPPNQILLLDTNCQGIVPNYISLASISDNCSSISNTSQTPSAGSVISGLGNTIITISATDSTGNLGDCNFTVFHQSPQLGYAIMQPSANPCQGDTVILTGNQTAFSYQWSTGSTSASISVNTTGWYWCDFSNFVGCSMRDSVFVSFFPSPSPVLNQIGNQICTSNFVNYQWFLNGQAILGDTSRCTDILQDGTYSVMVENSNGCFATSLSWTLVSMETIVPFGFSIYPNPTKGEVKIRAQSPIYEAGTIRLFDLSGKLLHEKPFDFLDPEMLISTQSLAKGSYILELRSASFSGRKQIIKIE